MQAKTGYVSMSLVYRTVKKIDKYLMLLRIDGAL